MLTLLDAKWRNFHRHQDVWDQEFNQLLIFEIDKKRYCLNTPGGQYYYAHVCDISDSFCEGKFTFGSLVLGKEKKIKRQQKELDDFLMRAVDSIDFSYDFDEDPSLKFTFHSRLYLLWLLFIFLGLFASYFSYLKVDEIIQKAVKVGKLTDTAKMRPIIMLVIYFDSFVMLLVLISGLVAQYTLKTNIYKLHSICLVSSILSIIPLSYLSEVYLIVFTSRMMCYIYCRYIISIIYNSLVYPIFQNISNDDARAHAIERFNNFIKFGQARVIQNFMETQELHHREPFSISQRIFRS